MASFCARLDAMSRGRRDVATPRASEGVWRPAEGRPFPCPDAGALRAFLEEAQRDRGDRGDRVHSPLPPLVATIIA